MKLFVKVGIAALDAQQVSVCSGIEPALVNLFCLLTKGEGNSQFVVAHVSDVNNEPFDSLCEVLVGDFSRLNDDGAVFLLKSKLGCLEHFEIIQVVTQYFIV